MGEEVRGAGCSVLPQWGSIRFRPLTCAYAPWGVRADGLVKPRKTPTRKTLRLSSVICFFFFVRLGVGSNRLWLGDVDAGVFVTPRGAGDDWTSPTYGVDYPIYPYLPTSWAGVGAAGANTSIYGANVTLQHAAGVARNATPAAVVCTVFSGPRTLGSTPTQFLFDMMFTPSHPLDLASHWKSRYLQIGYGGVEYTTPAAVAATGVTVATLHQVCGWLRCCWSALLVCAAGCVAGCAAGCVAAGLRAALRGWMCGWLRCRLRAGCELTAWRPCTRASGASTTAPWSTRTSTGPSSRRSSTSWKTTRARYAPRAVQFHPHGGQFDFVWLSARAPHVGPQYVW